jgi:predicted RNA-binding Zn ribbon-like protein
MDRGQKAPRVSGGAAATFVGGRLALDFANLQLPDANSNESLEGYSAFVEFLAASGVIRDASKPTLLILWETAPDETVELLRKAASFCGAMRTLFQARIDYVEILPGWIAPINEILAHTKGYDRLEPLEERGAGKSDWRLALHARAQGLEWLLTAIARSAAELIAEGPQSPIRRCANPDCGLFFYDNSRTGKRRWCSMAVCGNRAKVAAHYRREKNKS